MVKLLTHAKSVDCVQLRTISRCRSALHIFSAKRAAYEAAASLPAKPYEVKEVYFAAEKEAVKPQLINPYA